MSASERCTRSSTASARTSSRPGSAALLDYAENQARAVIRDIPDGEYFFADYADEDQAGGYPVRIAVTLKIHGDTLTMDYTGSDPQLVSSLNMPTGGKERHSLAMVGVVYALYCLDPTAMLNAGFVRPARCGPARGIGDERGHAGRSRHAQPDEQSSPKQP